VQQSQQRQEGSQRAPVHRLNSHLPGEPS